jgi:signal transduction histidine kinase
MQDLAQVSAQHLQRIRRDRETHSQRLRLDSDDRLNAALVQAGADLVWQADSDGILQVTHIFHGRGDLARQIHGQSLAAILPAGTDVQAFLASNSAIRFQPITPPGAAEELFLTVTRRDETAPLCGTVCAFRTPPSERVAVEAVLLEAIMGARQREEMLRREAEAMMLGLRLLLGDLSFREKLERLAHHLTAAIDCDEVRLIQKRPGERPRLLLQDVQFDNRVRRLENLLDAADARPVNVFKDGSEDAVFLSNTLDMRSGDIVLIALSALAERHYLLCRARSSLTMGDQDLAERISLLLQQALLLQGDQQRMIHTAKLSALGQMSTSIAHELRQPLNTISIAAQNIELMVEREKLDSSLLMEKSARILSQVERACKVMDRMRRFGRKTVGEYVVVSLAEMTRSARSLMDKIVLESGISIDIDVPEDLNVLADELEIEQVLVNLIQNSADAIAEKQGAGGKIRMSVADAAADPAMVHLQVEDNGPGFPEDVQKHALDAFFTTKPQGKGTGLGLSIAHSILREHGGRLLIGNGKMGGMVTLILRRAGPDMSPARGGSLEGLPLP